MPASAATDGNTATRWSSAFADPQWIRVDLGATAAIDQVILNWEAAYARSFQIQTSADGNTWTTVYSTTTGSGGIQNLAVTGTGRYVRMNGTARATVYGYSLWEFIVRTTGGGNPDPNPDPAGFWGDTTTIPAAQNVLTVKILNRTNGRYPDSQVFWSFNGQTRPSPRLAVVAVGEASNTHGTNWVKEQPYLPADQLAVIQNFADHGIPVVVLPVMPRPYVITEWHNLARAVVVTYRGGEEMGPAVASLPFGDYTPRGRLPWQPPRSLDQVLRPGGTDVPADAT